eukprot:4755350-Pyramimonas_sp.AAC.1
MSEPCLWPIKSSQVDKHLLRDRLPSSSSFLADAGLAGPEYSPYVRGFVALPPRARPQQRAESVTVRRQPLPLHVLEEGQRAVPLAHHLARAANSRTVRQSLKKKPKTLNPKIRKTRQPYNPTT